jgi:uncharacterized RDD family membrane protein YckC
VTEWYYNEGGQTRGPVDDDAIRVLASLGRLTSLSPLMQSGASQWSTLGACEAQLGLERTSTGGYGPVGAPPPPPPPGYVPPPPGYGAPPPGYGAPPPGYGMASGYRAADGPVTAFGRMASAWWKRAVALIIDGVILSIPISLLTSMSGGGFERTTIDGETHIEWHGGGLFIGVIVGLLYYALLNGSAKGQTIGKMAMRIQVRDIDTGGPIGVGRGFGRQLMIYLFTFACVIPLFLDYLSPLWDRRRQAWHDKVVRSVVVDVL